MPEKRSSGRKAQRKSTGDSAREPAKGKPSRKKSVSAGARREPATARREPGTARREPGTARREPATARRKPASARRKTAGKRTTPKSAGGSAASGMGGAGGHAGVGSAPVLEQILRAVSPEENAAETLVAAVRDVQHQVRDRPLDESVFADVMEAFVVAYFRPPPSEVNAFRAVGRSVGRRLAEDPAGWAKMEQLWAAQGGAS